MMRTFFSCFLSGFIFLAIVFPQSSSGQEKKGKSSHSSLMKKVRESNFQKAIREKQTQDPEINRRLESPYLLDRLSAVNGLSLILTNESCERLKGLLPSSDGPLRAEIFRAIGQHVSNPDLEKNCKDSLKSLLQSVVESSVERQKDIGGAFFEAKGKWSYENPHALFLESLKSIRSQSLLPRETAEHLKAQATRGWMHARYARLAQLPAAAVPEIPAELVGEVVTELRQARSLELKKILFFGASHWKVELPLDLVLQNLNREGEREFTVIVFKQLLRFPRTGLEAHLVPFFESSDPLLRLTTFQALAKTSDVREALLRSLFLREMNPPIRAQMFKAYLSSSVAVSDLQTVVKLYDEPSSLPFEWMRALSLQKIIGLLDEDQARLAWIKKGLTESAFSIQLESVKGVARLKSLESIESLFLDIQKSARSGMPAAVIGVFLQSVNEKKLQSKILYQAMVPFLKHSAVKVRATALEHLLSYDASAELIDQVRAVVRASPELQWMDFRLETVKKIHEKWKDELGTVLLEEIRSTDPHFAVSNEARKYLIERGVVSVPPARAEAFPYSPFSEMQLTVNAPLVELETSRGNVRIELAAALAPEHVKAFLGLIESGFYDGMEFYRVEPDFVVQGGDREGTGWGNVPFQLRGENSAQAYTRGSLGMARSASLDSGSSHFFLTLVETPALEGLYTYFGKVVKGLSVLESLDLQDRILKARVLLK
jgi:peptidylprolyl isomerase